LGLWSFSRGVSGSGWGGAAIDTGAQGLQGVGVQGGGCHVGLGKAGFDGLQGLGDGGGQGGGGLMGYRGFVMLVPREEVVMIGLVRVGGGAGTEAQ